jgi:WD40 repeat protein
MFIRTLSGHTDGVLAVAFSPDGQWLASGSRDRTVRLWQVSDGTLMRTLSGHTDHVTSVAFSPDGQYLASGSRDGQIRLWQASDGSLIRLITSVSGLSALAFSPDGQYLASGDSYYVALWRVSDGEFVRRFNFFDSVMAIAFSPNGQTIGVGSAGMIGSPGNLALWQVADGSLERLLEGHQGAVASVAFYGGYLASGGWLDRTIRFWRTSDGSPIRLYDQEMGNGINSLCFSPNGRLFAVGRRDASLFVARNPFWQQGDTDGNGCVDDADLLQVLFDFGQTGMNLPADMNEDGIIDDADLLIVLFAFGQGC